MSDAAWLVLPASMRPGQSCPGVGKTGVKVCVATACFNEAGAIMPGVGGNRGLRRGDRPELQ